MPKLQSGSYVGSYEILAAIGSGGQGEVYKARDTKLKRDVAIKVLPSEFQLDPERLARAQREAEVLASLNHPHIAQIYGLEESGGARCLVLEFVDGETVQERLRRGPIPMEEALEFARQIADALEAAHARGIVHRDLKPANVKITPDEKVKVLDFGLAKVTEPTRAEDFSQSPTVMSNATGGGVILGTTAYMSPEQAKGKPADARSDIWSFGVVLYEMLTGMQAFTGETMIEVLGGVMKADPDWTVLPPATPAMVRSLIRRCLQRDRHRRLHDIADVRIQIEEALAEPHAPAAPVVPVRNRRERLWMVTTLIAVFAAVAFAALYFRPTSIEIPETRLQIVTPPTPNVAGFAISPDGRKVVFQATAGGKAQLWLRPLETDTATPLAGTENGQFPFWSPDSRSIGFFADQKVKRLDIGAGAAQSLVDAPGGTSGGSWSGDGVILFAKPGGGLLRVAASGGKVADATVVDPSQPGVQHKFPFFLPDSRHFLFFETGPPQVQGIYIGSLDSKDVRRILDADAAAVFAPPDYVLFGRQQNVFAQRIDIGTLEPIGDVFLLAERMATPLSLGGVALSASAAGPLAYRTVGAAADQFFWFDRSGKQIGAIGQPDASVSFRSRLSPDGRTVALDRGVGGNRDIWLMETARGVLSRFTFDPALDDNPVWSPDGNRIAFSSFRKGVGDIYQRGVNGNGTDELLLESPETKVPEDWSLDGRFILYSDINPKTARDIWALPLDGDRKPFVVVQTAFQEANGRFSADCRWIAYESNESGRAEIYVQSFPGPGRRSQISIGGGSSAVWRRDGREIYYMAPDNRLMAVPITLPVGDRAVEVGTAIPLFTTRSGSAFDVSSDGQRFLVNTPLEDAVTPPITVILNWAGRKK